MREIRFHIIASFLVLQFALQCSAEEIFRGVTLQWRENGANDSVVLNEIFGLEYNNGNDQTEICPAHPQLPHTTMAGRRFEHIHVTFSFPSGGLTITHPLTGQQRTITESKIKDFWDNYFGPPMYGTYSGGSGMTFSKNCWGWTKREMKYSVRHGLGLRQLQR